MGGLPIRPFSGATVWTTEALNLMKTLKVPGDVEEAFSTLFARYGLRDASIPRHDRIGDGTPNMSFRVPPHRECAARSESKSAS